MGCNVFNQEIMDNQLHAKWKGGLTDLGGQKRAMCTGPQQSQLIHCGMNYGQMTVLVYAIDL